jgi:hypothetical protein
MDSPGFGDFLGTLIYTAVTILLAAARAIAIVVIAYGFIATAVCVLSRPDLHTILHRSTTRMDLLGMVQGVHPIRLLLCFIGEYVRSDHPFTKRSGDMVYTSCRY